MDKSKLTYNERLELAGVKTIRDDKVVFLEYNGKKILRPIQYIEAQIEKELGVII